MTYRKAVNTREINNKKIYQRVKNYKPELIRVP